MPVHSRDRAHLTHHGRRPGRTGPGHQSNIIARCSHPGLPGANHRVMAQFVAHGSPGPSRPGSATAHWRKASWSTPRSLVHLCGGANRGQPVANACSRDGPDGAGVRRHRKGIKKLIKESEPCRPVGRGTQSEKKGWPYSTPSLVGPERAERALSPIGRAGAVDAHQAGEHVRELHGDDELG